jgi:hypothetical protein
MIREREPEDRLEGSIGKNEKLQLRKSVQEMSSTGTEDDGKTSVHRFEGSNEEESKKTPDDRENQDTPKAVLLET